MGDKIENYGPGKDGRPFKESEIDTVKDIQPFLKSLPLALQHKCDTHASNNKMCLPPYSSYAHFTGSKKPWQEGFSKYRVRRTDNKELEGPYRLYYQRLFQLSERFSWGIDSDTVSAKFKNMKESVLGYMPSLHDHANHIQRHRNATMGL